MGDGDLSELARQFQMGDLECLRLLVEAMSPLLTAVAYRYTHDRERARDLCQETWIRVHERIARYDPRRPFPPWLLAIHRHGCLSHLRRPAVRRESPMADNALWDTVPDERAPDPSERLEQREFGRQLRRALIQLSKRQQEVFALVDLEQQAPRDAARILDMHPTTLRTTLHFARRRLAQILRDWEEAP